MFRAERKAWIIFVSILIIFNIPNILPWERNSYPETYLFDLIERLLKSALLGAIFLCFFRVPWKAWMVAWGLFLWWMPMSIAMRILNTSSISPGLVATGFASSPSELRNLISILNGYWIFALFTWNVGCYFFLKFLIFQKEWSWTASKRKKITIISFIIFCFPIVSEQLSLARSEHGKGVDSETIDPWTRLHGDVGSSGDLSLAYPFELPISISQYLSVRKIVAEVVRNIRPVPFHEKIKTNAESPEVVILVIGESSSRRAWHLFNQMAPESTPNLDNEWKSGALYKYSDVVAQSIATRQAVPSLLTNAPLIWPNGQPNSYATRSIISIASEAGYRTAWYSNQSAIGRFDGVISAYADEADTKAFLNPSDFTKRGSYDEILLSPIKNFIQGEGKEFIIVHTLGSHFDFESRYPPGYGLYKNTKNISEKYFNSILYTDNFLKEIFLTLTESNKSAVLLYTSDHGQGVPEEYCKRGEINRITGHAYEVPVFIWGNEKFQKDNADLIMVMKGNVDKPYTNGAIYQSLKDLMTGQYNAEIENPSLLRSSISKPRVVVSPSQEWVDFDVAAKRNYCSIAVAK